MLKRFHCAAALLLALAAPAFADPKDDLAAAAKKLADAPSYSFSSTSEMPGGFGMGPQTTTGKSEKDYAILTVPAFGFGGDAPPPIEAAMKGNVTVVKMPDGWKTTVELAAAAQAAAGAAGAAPGGFNFSPEQSALFALANVALPTTTLTEALVKIDNVKKTDDGFSADLSPDAVKNMLAFRGFAGAPQIVISAPKGTLKTTLKDGTITKILLQLSGTIDFGGGQPFDLARTTTIDLKDLGTTKVSLPDEAKKKLDNPPAVPPPTTTPARGPSTRPAN